MEFHDAVSIPLLTLIVLVFWAAIPGLITGLMLHESGRSFGRWFMLGAMCGPLGVPAALIFIFAAGRRGGSGRRGAGGAIVRRPRMVYELPLVGPLHASTVWTLAGLATVACIWVLGGLAYEWHLYESQVRPAGDNGVTAIISRTQHKDSMEIDAATTNSQQPPSVDLAAKAATSQQTSMLGGAAARSSSTDGTNAPFGSVPENRLTAPMPSGPVQNVASSADAALLPPVSAPERSITNAAAPTSRAAPQARDAIVADLKQSLGARGYRVHAAVSGDAQTATLTLSCATLTRELGGQTLGNSRTREALKASGIRIVVMINGQESWTYML